MGKCDEIRELYKACCSDVAQEAYENIITALGSAIKNGECRTYFTIKASEVVATLSTNYKVYTNILPVLGKKFKEEGFTFTYSSAGLMGSENSITISGWAD